MDSDVEIEEPEEVEKRKKKWKVLFEKDSGEGPMDVLGEILQVQLPGADKPTAQDAQDMEDRLNKLEDSYQRDRREARKKAEASGVVYKRIDTAEELVAHRKEAEKEAAAEKSPASNNDDLEPVTFTTKYYWTKKRAIKEFQLLANSGKHNPAPQKLQCKHAAL